MNPTLEPISKYLNVLPVDKRHATYKRILRDFELKQIRCVQCEDRISVTRVMKGTPKEIAIPEIVFDAIPEAKSIVSMHINNTQRTMKSTDLINAAMDDPEVFDRLFKTQKRQREEKQKRLKKQEG